MIVNDQNLETCKILIFSNIFMKTKRYNGASQINSSIKTKDYSIPVVIYLLKVNNRNTRRRCEICSKLTVKTQEQSQWRRFCVFIVNFEHISDLVLVFPSLSLNM